MPTWAARPYKGLADAGPKGIVSPVRFERTLPPASGACLLPLGYEDKKSRHPVPTRVIRRTKAEPQPCAAASMERIDPPRSGPPLSCPSGSEDPRLTFSRLSYRERNVPGSPAATARRTSAGAAWRPAG